MGRFNFDILFEGNNETQAFNVHNFMHGAAAASKDIESRLAMAILRGDGGRNYLDSLKEIEDMLSAFVNDPRAKSLTNWLGEEKAKRTEAARADLGHKLAEELMKVL